MEQWNKVLKPWHIVVIVIFIIWFMWSIGSDDTSSPSQPTPTPQTQTVSKADAEKELVDLMALSKKAGLITSYEFSDKATEVFVGSAWYTQKVQFKKDFIAKIGLLKKAITGYAHFEAKDAYSNEKVAEITAFSGSIEIYK